MVEAIKTHVPRGRRRTQIFSVILLIFLPLLLIAGAQRAVPQGVSSTQEGPSSSCNLKKDVADCSVKSDERVRALRPGIAAEEEIASGERHLYKVTLSSGQFLQAVIDQRGIDLTASICNQDGQRVAEVDRQSGSWGPETISLIAKTDGEYLLQVRTLENSVGGRYEIRIKEFRDSVPLDEVQINAERIVTEGGKYFNNGKPDCLLESIRKYEQALKLWQSLGNDYEVAVTLYGLGWSYTNLGAYGMVKFPSPSHQLRWSYESREDHLTALKYFKQAFDMMKALDSRHGQALTLVGLAYPNLYLGRSQEALNNFSQARQLFNSSDNKRGEAIAAYGLGWAYALLNENEKALENFLQALQLRQESKDQKGEANTLSAISRMYNRLGKNPEALDYGKRALNLYQQQDDGHGQASTLSILGWVYSALGRQQDALHSFEEMIRLRGNKDSTGKANALYGIAHVEDNRGNLTEALSKMKEVLDLIEPLRTKGGSSDLRTYYFSNVQEYYEFYIDLLMRTHKLRPTEGYAETAFGISERARARELLAVLAQSDEGSEHDYDSELAKPLDAAGIKNLLDDGTLLLEYSLGTERSYLWLVSSKEVLSYVLPKRAEIEDKARNLNQLLTERNRNLSDIQDPARKLNIIRADTEALKVADELSQALLKPVVERLGGKRLVVVTQGALQLVPFGALPAPNASLSTSRVSKPLIIDHEVVSLPSASILNKLRRNASRSSGALKTIAVLADPVFAKDDPRVNSTPSRVAASSYVGYRNASTLSSVAQADNSREKSGTEAPDNSYRRLPGTRWEAQQIISLVPKEDGFMALDFAASRGTALSDILRQYRIIHFATHAFVDDINPALSKIVLSKVDEQGRPQDGDLTLADIYKMNLQADLVTLSACRTGLGANTEGEGLIGLTGGFMHAGVPRVLVSLWPISDSVAADLMAKLYRKMLGKQKLSPLAALRKVQIEMLEDERWKSAYFWAPFTFQGEWR